jgi:hypothetical protein
MIVGVDEGKIDVGMPAEVAMRGEDIGTIVSIVGVATAMSGVGIAKAEITRVPLAINNPLSSE